MRRLAIVGAGGHGKVVADTAEQAGWESIIFFDDFRPVTEPHVIWPVAGNLDRLLQSLDDYDGISIALGDNQLRLSLCLRFIALNAPLVSVIHPAAVISRHADIGLGTVIFAGAVINACASIGIGGIVNTGACIDHDCRLGNGVHISPGAHLAGNVDIGDLSWIGIGASVKHNIKIGLRVNVGAGAAVVNNIPDGRTVVGVPAIERSSFKC
jgi:sugar O-acyltransferase (sialic acid O-acetyltransferase NeuD family)